MADDLDVRVLLFRLGDRSAALAVADVGLIWPATSLWLRSRLAAFLGIPPESVGLFCTQNHCAPFVGTSGGPDLARFAEAFLSASGKARAALRPVEMAAVSAVPGKPLAFCRRLPVPGLGAFTFWFGYRIDPASGRSDVAHLLKEAMAALAAGRPGSVRCDSDPAFNPGAEPAWLPAASDGLAQGLFFQSLDGKPVASLLRFAAHPATTNRAGAGYWSGDYPAYARRRLEERFGGTAVFLTGPCGDQCPPISRKSTDLAAQVGAQLAETVLAELPATAWTRPDRLEACSPEVCLRFRADLPATREEARREQVELEPKIRGAAGAGRLDEAKRLAERHEVLGYYECGSYTNWSGFGLEGRAGRAFAHPLFALRLGDALLLGLPGEPFGRYSVRLREAAAGHPLLVAEEANGYLSYFPGSDDYGNGSYESCAALTGPESEDELLRGGRAALARLGIGPEPVPDMIDAPRLVDGLRRLGLAAGDRVLVHSSLRSLGQVTGGAEAVVDALLEAVSPGGAVFFPTLPFAGSMTRFLETVPEGVDLRASPSLMGAITRAAAGRKEARRSLHPTHPVVGLGHGVETFLAGHPQSTGPCGEHSPYCKLARAGGKILLLGVTSRSNTTLHAAEELAAPYMLGEKRVFQVPTTGMDGTVRTVAVRAYPVNLPRDFMATEPPLFERGILAYGRIGAALCRLIDSGAMLDWAVSRLRENGECLLAGGPGFTV